MYMHTHTHTHTHTHNLYMTQTHGECNPPLLSSARGNAQADTLARWVRQQRHLHQSGSLRPDRAARHTQKKSFFF